MPDNNKLDLNINLDPQSILNEKTSKYNLNTGSKGYFGDTDFGKSQYDRPQETSWNDITPEKLQQLRGERQGWGAEAANAIGGGIAKIPFTVIGNVASMLDFEDYYNTNNEVGNAVTAWAEEVKGDIEGATKIYKSNDNTLGSREWWLNNAKGLIDSAGAFAITGAGLGKGVQLLSQLTKYSKVVQGIGTVTNAAMLNQAESIPIAMGVYQKSYDIELNKLQQSQDPLNPSMSDEEMDAKARQAAADAAAYSININRINIPLNLTSAGAFLRPIALTRQVAKDASKKQILGKLLLEGSQEYVEENVNMIAENEAIRSAKEGNKYTYDFNNTVNEVLSKEGFETGIVGFLGGIMQTGATNAIKYLQKDSPSYDEDGNVKLNEDGSPVLVNTYQSQKERFRAQQKSINNIEILSKSESVPTIKETLDNVKTTATILNDIQEAAMNNDEFKVSELQNDLLINQATDAFKNGTTEQLINLYKSITNDPSSKEKFGEDYRIKAQEAIKEIENLEKVYQKHSVLPQVGEVIANKAKVNHNIKQAEAVKQEVLNAQINQQREMEVTGFSTPEQIATLSSTKDLQELKAKEELIKSNVIALTEEYNKIISPEYTQVFTNKKLEDVAAKEVAIEDNFREPVVTTPGETPVTPVEEDVVSEEGQPASEEQIISYLGDKIINRKGGEIFTPEEQQIYDNFKDRVKKYIASKANVNSQPAGYADIALDYLFTGGKDTILSTDYLLQALVGGFPKAAIEINNIRNKYADKLGNIKDDINSDIYNKTMQEIRNVINKNYNNLKALEILDKILKNPTGFTTKEGRQVEIELDNLNQPEVTTPEVSESDETISNGASNAFDISTNLDETLDKPTQISDKEFTSKVPNALMMKHYEFQPGKKVWARDSEGLVIEESNPSVSIAVSNPNVAEVGSEVTYVHAGDEITLLQNAETEQELVVGKLALPHETTSTDPKVLAALEELKKLRAYILSKPSGSLKTTIAEKGKGKLLIKIKNNLPVLDQKVSTRPQDLVDNKPLFLYDNGESLVGKELSDNQQVVANQFTGTSYAVENPSDPQGTKLGVGRVFQVVKTANDSWSVIPVFTEFIGKSSNSEKVTNTIVESLINNISNNGMSINYNKLIQELNKYIFISSGNKFKNHSGIKVFESKEGTEIGKINVAGNTFKFTDIKSNNPVIIAELKQALQSSRFNLDVNNLNKSDYQEELLGNNVLVTNAYTDSNDNYYVQPYIQINNPEGYIATEVVVKKPFELVTPTNVNSENSYYDKRNKILSDKRDEILTKLKNKDLLLAAHYLLSKSGISNEYGSDTTLFTKVLKISFKEAEKLSKQHLEAIKPEGWKFGDDYDNSKLSNKLNEEILEINNKYDKILTDFETNFKNSNTTETKESDVLTSKHDLENFEEGSDLAFSRTKLEGTEITSKSIEKLNKILPGLTLADAKQVEEVGKNMKDTYGMFHNMLIYLFNGATNQTMYHEAFHGVFRNILSNTERIGILNDAVVKYDKPTVERLQFLREGKGNENLSDEVLTQLHYEERLADDFGKYADGELNQSLGKKILNFFKKIFDLFNIFKNSNPTQTDKLFSEIVKGKLADRSKGAKLANLPISYKDFGQAYVRVLNKISMAAELDRTKSIADQVLDRISQEVAKGTPLNKITNTTLAQIIADIKKQYAKTFAEEDSKANPDLNKLKIIKEVYDNFNGLLENISKQIKSTRNLNIDLSNLSDPKVLDLEGIQDTKEDEIVSSMEGNETKGWKEMTTISGIKTATHEIKLFLSNIPVVKKNGEVDIDIYGFTKFHSFEEIYHTLEHTLIGTTTFAGQAKKLQDLSAYKPVLKQVLEAIESIKNPETKAKFKQQFAANFNKQVLNYKLITYKKVGDSFDFKIFDPNREGVEVALKTKWESTNILDPNNLVTNDIRTFNTEEGSYEVNSDKVKALVESYKGKDLNVQEVFELANKLGVGLSYDTIETFNNIPSVNKFTPLQNLTRDLLSYASNKWVNKKFSDARTTFNQLVKMELNAQTALFTSSFNNVENSSVYAIQYQSFASKLVDKLSNDQLGSELKKDLERDPLFKNNFLFKNRHNLVMFPLDGLKMEGDTNEGKKFNQIDSDDYIAMIINMFVNKQAEGNMTNAPALYAPIIPAEKGLSFGFSYDKLTVPENLEGSTFLGEFRQLFLNELARIKQVTKDIKSLPKEKLVNNYHLGKKLGLEFNLTNAINSELKTELNKFLETQLDSNEDLLTALSKTNLLAKVDAALIKELEHVAKTEKQALLDKNIVQLVDGKLVSDKISSTIPENTIDKIVREWSLNSYLFNISSSLLINGDPAFYKGPADNGKRYYQGYSMLKFADTSTIDESYKYLKGAKFKMNIIEDVYSASESLNDLVAIAEETNNPRIKELAEDNYATNDKGVGMINNTDAQMFVSEAMFKELQKVFGQESDKLAVLKPFSYGNQWNAETKRYEPVQVKCSIFPLTNAYVENNPLLAEHKKLMDVDENYPQVIAFESTMKALSPFKADISTPESTSIVELDLNNFGEQVANPDHMLDSENSSLRQLKMLFYGMVENKQDYNGRSGRDIKNEIALLDKANIEEALQKVIEGFATNNPELTKMIQEAITSRNATSIIEKVFQQNPDGTFQYPLDLISSKSTIQLISSIFSGNVTRQAFTGGAAVQVSSIGLQVGASTLTSEDLNSDAKINKLRTSLKYIKSTGKDSIDFCEAAAPVWMKEFVNQDGSIKDNIPEEMKQMLVYRIPTEGAHSMMAVKVVHFLPAEYKGVMLLPYEVTTQFGADFDFDKIMFISRASKSVKGEIKPYVFIPEVDKTEERYSIYKEYSKDNKLTLEEFSKLSIIEQNIKPARDNKLLDNYFDILKSTSMLESLITPSGPGNIAKVAKELEEKSTKKKSNNYFTALNQVALKDLFHKISRLKGIAALQVSGHAWATEGNLNIKPKTKTDGTFIPQGVKIKSGNTTNTRNNLNQVISDDNTKIVEELSAMMAVILDAVKTPEMLPSIGITEKTLPLWSYIVILGLGADIASRITAQPAIKDLSSALESNDKQLKSKNFKRKSIDTVIGDYKALYNKEFEKIASSTNTSEAYTALKDKVLGNNTLSSIEENDIIDSNELKQFTGLTLEDLNNPKAFDEVSLSNNPLAYEVLPEYKKLKFLQLQIALLNMYANNEKVITELGQLNNLFSINKETGPNFEDVNGKLELYKTLSSENTLIEGIATLLNSNAIKPYIDTVQAQYNVLQQHYNFASGFFNTIKNEVAQKVYGTTNIDFTRLKSDDRDAINGFIQMYLDAETTFKDIYLDENRLSEKEFMDDMAMLTSENTHKDVIFKIFGKAIPVVIQERLKNMALFQLLQVSNLKNSDVRTLSIRGNGKIELNQKELIINDLLTLWNEPSKVYKPLVKHLVEHSFINTGFFSGFSSYAGYIDPSILQDLGLSENRANIRKTILNNAPETNKVNNIVDQLFRNFAKKFTKTYDNENKLFNVLEDGKTLVIDKDSTDPRLKEITGGEILVPYIRFKMNKDYTPLYKLDEEASKISKQPTYRQITYLGQPGKRLEINPFGEVITEFPNNRYEKLEIKVKALSKPKNLVPVPQVESEEVVDNSESLYEGFNEILPSDQDVIEESINFSNNDWQSQEKSVPLKNREIKVNQYTFILKPNGEITYSDGKILTDETIINKVNIRKELQDGTLRTSNHKGNNYFVTSDNKILGSGITNLGKESVSNPKIKELILAKAVIYKKNCN